MNIVNEIINIIHTDDGLTQEQKEELTAETNKKRIARLLSGGTGAGIGLALARYRSMSPTAQTILSGLGFGAGVIIYNYINRDRFSNYNEKTRMYEIK